MEGRLVGADDGFIGGEFASGRRGVLCLLSTAKARTADEGGTSLSRGGSIDVSISRKLALSSSITLIAKTREELLLRFVPRSILR